MGGMTLWVSYSNPFWRLDRYINHHRTSAQELQARFKEPRPAFGPTIQQTEINLDGSASTAITIPKPPMPQATQTHFDIHWIGRPGIANSGGLYWTYID